MTAPSLQEIDRQLPLLYTNTLVRYEPLPIRGKRNLLMLLDLHAVPHATEWGDGYSRTLPQLIRDMRRGEATIVLYYPSIAGFQEDHAYLTRMIRTVSIRITYDLPDPTPLNPEHVRPLVLREYRTAAGGALHPRKFPNPSETMVRKDRTQHHTILRLLREELGIRITHRQFRSLIVPNLTFMPSALREFEDQCAGRQTELAIHASDKYPGLWTHNEVWHYLLKLPTQFYQPDGYREDQNVSLWEDAEHKD
ncbi:MAG TPA: hypothetical protein VHO23_01665 [Candidatus Paceibacterota bacterium]|nr:hypothetical protein [Candidatus Paceibacterota bacterium]